MKRAVLVLMLILLGVPAFAQNRDISKNYLSEQDIANLVFQKLLQGLRVIPVQGSDTLKVYVTQGKKDTLIVKTNLSGATINASITDIGVKGVSSIGNNTVTVGVTAAQVSASSVPCRWVSILNNTNGATIYIGSSTVTTSNGYAVLGYKDAIKIDIDNLNKLYLISSQASTDVRYIYGN